MIKTRSFKLIITAVLTFAITLFGFAGFGTIKASAEPASDLTVTIDTGASITLSDADGDGTPDEYVF